jgi:hypothetical protein
MKFSQIAEGITYVGAKGVSREVVSISETNVITYKEPGGGGQGKMPGQDFAKWAKTAARDRSKDKPKEERRSPNN